MQRPRAPRPRRQKGSADLTYVYLDPDHFLEIRTVNRRIEHGVPSETITDYGDYEKVNGVYLAFARESWPKGGGASSRQKVQYDKAEANIPLDQHLFEFPAPAHSSAAASH